MTTTTRKAAATPNGVADLTAKAQAHALDFAFQHGGKTYYLPPIKGIKVGVTRKVRHLEPVDAMFTILETVASADTLAALDAMTMEELGVVTTDWQRHSGVSLGE